MATIDITNLGLGAAFLLLLIPLGISFFWKLKLARESMWAVGRMSLQLFVVGFFLEFIFEKNQTLLTLGWFLLMVLTAVFSASGNSRLKLRVILEPIILAFIFPTLGVLLYFTTFIIQLDQILSARYLIAIGGMLLGNVMSANIVAVNNFYQQLRTQKKYFLYRLGIGATQSEALRPFVKNSFQLSLKPILAKTATIGIVTLPGMMSGQIIGGSSPTTALRYQIAIMIAIYVAASLSVLLSLWLSQKKCFTQFGVLKEEIFK